MARNLISLFETPLRVGTFILIEDCVPRLSLSAVSGLSFPIFWFLKLWFCCQCQAPRFLPNAVTFVCASAFALVVFLSGYTITQIFIFFNMEYCIKFMTVIHAKRRNKVILDLSR